MRELLLSGKNWRNPDNLWDDLLEALGAPSWHGRNLDALNDSIGQGSINEVEVPYRIVIQDVHDLPKSVIFLLCRVARLVDDLRQEGIEVELAFPEGKPAGWDYVGGRDAILHMRVLDVLREWDPIGIYGPGSTCPDDEYDNYAPGIIRQLEKGKSAKEIARHLAKIAKVSMGLPNVDAKSHEAAADQLMSIWTSRKMR